MKIKYHGHACFSVEDSGIAVVTDPFGDSAGLKMPKLKADVVIVSHKDPLHSNVKDVEGEPKALNWPGEYEVSGIHFKGIPFYYSPESEGEADTNLIFRFEFSGIHICHLGGLGAKLTPEQTENIEDVDILFVPVWNKESAGAKKTKEVIEQIEPRVIIPMMYHTEGSTAGFHALEPFLAEMGATTVEPIDMFTVKRSELPEDNSKVVVLNVS